MPIGAAKLKSDDLFAQINHLTASASHYFASDDPVIVALMREADSMIKADAAEAYSAKSFIHALAGDSERARYCIDNAIKLAPSNHIYWMNQSVLLVNLGFYSDALAVYKKAADPEFGVMTSAWTHGYVCGAFRTMKAHLQKARKMQLDLQGLDIDTAERAANVLEKEGINDLEIARVLDIAGQIMRDSKLFFLGRHPQVTVCDEQGMAWFVEMVYDFGVTPTEAHDMYRAYVDRVMDSTPAAPALLSVSFRSRMQRDERRAA